MIIQDHPMPGEAACKVLERSIQKEVELTGRKPDFIMTGEGFFNIYGEVSLDVNSQLAPVAEIAKAHGICIVVGAMIERPKDQGATYITAVLIGSDGTVLGKYRKRDSMSACHDGDSVGVFDTWGKVGLLICYDMENDGFVEETLKEKPQIVFIPTRIVPPRGISNYPEMAESTWRIGLETMKRRLEYLATVSDCVFVQVDLAYPSGQGSTFVSTPCRTIVTPSMHKEAFCLTVYPGKEDKLRGNMDIVPERTEVVDNIGFHYHIRALKVAEDPSSNEESARVTCFTFCRDRPKGKIVVGQQNGTVSVWDVVKGVKDCWFRGPEIEVTDVNTDSDGSRVYVSYADGATSVLERLEKKMVVVDGEQVPDEVPKKDMTTADVSDFYRISINTSWLLLWRVQSSDAIPYEDEVPKQVYYTINNPFNEAFTMVYYSTQTELLAAASDTSLYLIDFFVNRLPIVLGNFLTL